MNGILRHSKCYIAHLILLDVVANRQPQAMTQEEEALGKFTRLKLKTLVIQPEWQSPRAVLALHGTASTYPSCVEQPIQRLFFVLSAQLGFGVYESDATDAYMLTPHLQMCRL